MEHRFESHGLPLAAHLARPADRPGNRPPGLVLCHGFPSGAGGAATSGRTYPELADRIATEMGWVVLTFNFRGCGASAGNFSLGGWLSDLLAAVDHLTDAGGVSGVWAAGFGTGGALSICAAARDRRIEGVAALGAPADFDDWAGHPRRFIEHAREIGVIRDPGYPPAPDPWAKELKELRAVACVTDLRPRPLLVVHGSDDDMVPVFDARVVSDAHASAELRFIDGAGHRLRHDPRAVAVLLGWLDRQRHRRVGLGVDA